MGGRGSTRLVMKNPNMFCSSLCQAGNVADTADGYATDSPATYPNYYLGPDKQTYIDNDTFFLLANNLKGINQPRILIACGKQDDTHIVTIREFHQALLEHGVDHSYWELEALKHSRKQFIQLLYPLLYNYHVESFRRARSLDWTRGYNIKAI